jgi:hypothetical protein
LNSPSKADILIFRDLVFQAPAQFALYTEVFIGLINILNKLGSLSRAQSYGCGWPNLNAMRIVISGWRLARETRTAAPRGRSKLYAALDPDRRRAFTRKKSKLNTKSPPEIILRMFGVRKSLALPPDPLLDSPSNLISLWPTIAEAPELYYRANSKGHLDHRSFAQQLARFGRGLTPALALTRPRQCPLTCRHHSK